VREQDLLPGIERARQELALLRARLDPEGTERSASEVGRVIAFVQERLDMLLSRYGLLHEILARGSEVIFAKDREGRYMMINASGAELLGRSVEEIVGQDDRTLLEPASAEHVRQVDREVMATGMTQTFEEPFGKHGTGRKLRFTVAAWSGPDGNARGVIGSGQQVRARSVGEHEAAGAAEREQSRLRTLATEMLLAEERLRHDLGTELHNGIGQDIALLRMKLAALRASPEHGLSGELTGIEGLIEQAERSLRALTLRISPPILHDLGLVPALERLAEDLQASLGGRLVIVAEPDLPQLDERMRVLAFLAVRELLLAVQHADGSLRKASVHLSRAHEELAFVVTDRGLAFDQECIGTGGLRLAELGEFLRHSGGHLEFDSPRPGEVRASLRLPLAHAAPLA